MPRPERIEPMLMMRPCWPLIIGAANAREQRNAPVRLTSLMRRHSSSGISARSFGEVIPALLNRMSARPNSPVTRSQALLTCASSVTSASTTNARRPASFTAAAVASSFSTLRPTSARSAPASANATAAALPMPPPAPVTIATFPSRLNSGGMLIGSHRHLAAVDRQRDPSNHAGLVRHQEQRRVGNVLRLRHAAKRNGGAKPLHRFLGLRRHAGKEGLKHWRRNDGRAQGIGAYIMRRKLERETAHEADDAVLGNGVEAEIRLGLEALQRRGEKKRGAGGIPFAAGAQVRQCRTAHLHHAEQVGAQHPLHGVVVGVLEDAGERTAGIVVHDTERAELLHRERDGTFVVFAYGVIAGDGRRMAANFLGDRFSAHSVDIGDDYFGALGGEALRHGPTQAGAAAGHQRDFAREPAHALRSSAPIGMVSSSNAAMRPRRKRY